jgi:hypothetical protein
MEAQHEQVAAAIGTVEDNLPGWMASADPGPASGSSAGSRP